MKFIRPTAITDAMLTSSTVAEDDELEWDAGLSYSAGNRVMRTTTHRIYERQGASGVDATPPENASEELWIDVGPTNRWAMFDSVIGTVTTAADSITVVLEPGRINSLALLNLNAAEVTVTLEANAETVYSASFDLTDNSSVGNWYDYFYEPTYQQDSLTITDLLDAALLDIPAYGEGVLTVTISRPGGTVSVGMLVVGLVTNIGHTQHGATVAIRDYSRINRDNFGLVTFVRRDYSKVVSGSVVIDADRVDAVTRELSRYRATPVVWLGSDSYGSLVVYGFAADWRCEIANPSASVLTIDIEGLV